VDWSRYGDVMRSIEQLQLLMCRELLGIIHQGSDSQIRFSTNVQAPAHLDAGVFSRRSSSFLSAADVCTAYATGPLLDACLKESISQVEQVVGTIASSYVISRDAIDVSRRRFEQELQSTSAHLRQLAALTLSSRSVLKRRAEDPSDIGRYELHLPRVI
jgi:nuclear mRNA export protein SAC3